MAKQQKYRKGSGPIAALLALAILAAGLFTGQKTELSAWIAPVQDLLEVFSPQPQAEPVEGLLEVHSIDVGQGDCFFLRTPEQAVLIDSGERENADTIVEYLHALGVEQLDLAVATHPHSDHIGAMAEVLEQIPAQTILMPDLPDSIVPTTKTYERLLDTIEQQQIQVELTEPGMRYDLGQGAVLTVLGPVKQYRDLNLMSVVCRVDAGATSFLFTGDMEKEAEQDLIAAGANLHVDVLKAGHHGSSTSSSKEFLQEVSPLCTVISLGEGNSYGHPHKEAVERLHSYGPIYRTDLLGNIVFYSNGDSIYIQSQKGGKETVKEGRANAA